MPAIALRVQIEHIDIYLLDQILKGRYDISENILDAGCGMGRNLRWFYHNSYPVFGVDVNESHIKYVKENHSRRKDHFFVSKIEALQFEAGTFHHVICNAVLHFAKNESHFLEMFSELLRVLKTNGTLFVRVASCFGIESKIKETANGIYKLPDGSERFLLTKPLLNKVLASHSLEFIEPIKTTNVEDLRCMTTLMLKKLQL